MPTAQMISLLQFVPVRRWSADPATATTMARQPEGGLPGAPIRNCERCHHQCGYHHHDDDAILLPQWGVGR